MSNPARAWSETTTAWASVNCSRNHGSIMAVSSGRPQVFMLYQRGRGQEPVMVAGSIKSFVAVKAIEFCECLGLSGNRETFAKGVKRGKRKRECAGQRAAPSHEPRTPEPNPSS